MANSVQKKEETVGGQGGARLTRRRFLRIAPVLVGGAALVEGRGAGPVRAAGLAGLAAGQSPADPTKRQGNPPPAVWTALSV